MLFINVPHPFSIVLKRFYCSQEVLSKIPKPIENNRKWVWWVYKRLWYSFVSAMFYNNNKLYHAICISLAIRHFKIYNDKPRQRFRSKRKKSSCKTKRINNFQSQRQSRHFHVFRTAWTRGETRAVCWAQFKLIYIRFGTFSTVSFSVLLSCEQEKTLKR